MPLMNITVPHQLGRDEATRRLTEKLEQIKKEHTYTVSDLTETWPDPHSMEFSFKVLGFSLTGDVVSLDDAVRIGVDLPFAAMLMQKTIESQVTKELTQVLS